MKKKEGVGREEKRGGKEKGCLGRWQAVRLASPIVVSICGACPPPRSAYETCPHSENGVGTIRAFLDASIRPNPPPPRAPAAPRGSAGWWANVAGALSPGVVAAQCRWKAWQLDPACLPSPYGAQDQVCRPAERLVSFAGLADKDLAISCFSPRAAAAREAPSSLDDNEPRAVRCPVPGADCACGADVSCRCVASQKGLFLTLSETTPICLASAIDPCNHGNWQGWPWYPPLQRPVGAEPRPQPRIPPAQELCPSNPRYPPWLGGVASAPLRSLRLAPGGEGISAPPCNPCRSHPRWPCRHAPIRCGFRTETWGLSVGETG